MSQDPLDLEKVPEVQRLQYRSNEIPYFVRIAWTLFTVFALFYMIKFAWPDLALWCEKLFG